MATHSNGISALQLQAQLGIGSYKTAWLLARKLRRAMVHPECLPLAGLVEVDETSLPQRTRNDPPGGGQGRSGAAKMKVAGAVEIEGGKPGRLRLAAIEDFSAASLNRFIGTSITGDATIHTDAWSGHLDPPVKGHRRSKVGPMAAHIVLPAVHRAFSNLKRRALGTYHGLRPEHLQAYLDELTFRFNRRHNRHAAFHRLVGLATNIPHASYKMQTHMN